jgi:hypothetical protein
MPHPTPSLPFRVADEQDGVASNYDVKFTAKFENLSEDAESDHRMDSGGMIYHIWFWMLETLMEMDGRETDGYEGLQGKMKGRPPKGSLGGTRMVIDCHLRSRSKGVSLKHISRTRSIKLCLYIQDS